MESLKNEGEERVCNAIKADLYKKILHYFLLENCIHLEIL